MTKTPQKIRIFEAFPVYIVKKQIMEKNKILMGKQGPSWQVCVSG